MKTPSKEHLIKSFSTPEGYKETAVYIRQVQNQNQAIFKTISDAIIETFQTKINALRFFKDLFLTGEMDCIQQLDQKIEIYIIGLAKYKKQSKQINRGENYFIEKQKRKNTQQIKNYGINFHTLALQIIYCFGNWYPKDFDNESSRFFLYLQELIKLGVIFPPMKDFKFLKESDKSKFQKNYKRWLDKVEEQDQQVEQSKKQNNNKIPNKISDAKPPDQVKKDNEQLTNKQKQKQIQEIKKKAQLIIQELKTSYQQKQKGYLLKITEKQNIQITLRQTIKNLQKQIQQIRNVSSESQSSSQIYELKTELNNKQLEINIYDQKLKKQKQQIQRHNEIQQQYKNEILTLKKQLQKVQNHNQKNKNQQGQNLYKSLKQIGQTKSKFEKNQQQAKQQANQQQQFLINNSTQPIRSNKLSKTQQRSLDKKNFKLNHNSLSKKLQFNYQNQIFNFNSNTVNQKKRSYLHQETTNLSNYYAKNSSATMIPQKQSSPARKSIFGLKDLIGTEIKLVEKYFEPITMDMLQFRKSCYMNGEVFYRNRQIQIRIVEFFGDKIFKLILTNISNSTLKIQWNLISNKNYNIPKFKFNTNLYLRSRESQQQFIQIQINSFNFKFIYTSLKYERETIPIPIVLPITLLNFIRLKRYRKNFEENINNFEMIRSQQFVVQLIGIQKYFESYLSIDSNQRFQIHVLVNYEFSNEIEIGLKIRGFKNRCVIQVTYNRNSETNQNFSKILLQLLMFCFKSKN